MWEEVEGERSGRGKNFNEVEGERERREKRKKVGVEGERSGRGKKWKGKEVEGERISKKWKGKEKEGKKRKKRMRWSVVGNPRLLFMCSSCQETYLFAAIIYAIRLLNISFFENDFLFIPAPKICLDSFLN